MKTSVKLTVVAGAVVAACGGGGDSEHASVRAACATHASVPLSFEDPDCKVVQK